MEVTLNVFNSYDVYKIEGSIRINEIPHLTPRINDHLFSEHTKHLVFDLSDVKYIDSSGIRLLINAHRRIKESNRKMYVLNPSDEVRESLTNAKLDSTLAIIQSCDAIQQETTRDAFETYQPFEFSDDTGTAMRLRLACPICGSDNVVGYSVDYHAYEWTWDGVSPFPVTRNKQNGETEDIFRRIPSICLDCYMCAIEPNLFNALDTSGNVAISSDVDEDSKVMLSKAIKKRKSLLQSQKIVVGDDFFFLPRSDKQLYCMYVLAESCARSLVVNKKAATNFTIGFLNYLALNYCEDKATADEHIENCRTWLMQVINEKESYNPRELAQAYFIILNACLHMNKKNEASRIYNDFSDMMESVPVSSDESSNTPQYWFSQAHTIWQHEIQNRAQELKT